MDFFGGEIGRAIEGEQIMALEEGKGLKDLAALELAKDSGEGGAKLLRVDAVEDGAHLGVGRDVLEAEERLEVGFIIAALIVEGQKRPAIPGSG